MAQSAFGPHRVVPDRWKGMTPEQLADIRRMQDIQRREMEVGGDVNSAAVYCCVNYLEAQAIQWRVTVLKYVVKEVNYIVIIVIPLLKS